MNEPCEPGRPGQQHTQQGKPEPAGTLAQLGSGHGNCRNQLRTVPWAVRKPISAAATGNPGRISQSSGGNAASGLVGVNAVALADAVNGAARFASSTRTGSAASAPAAAPIAASAVARAAKRPAI